MKAVIAVLALVAAAYGGVIAPTTLVRTPSLDSAVIQSDRLGGNFAYSSVEGHAYAAISPVVQNVIQPVGVSYHATPVLTPINYPVVLPQAPLLVAGAPTIPHLIAPGAPTLIAPVNPGVIAPGVVPIPAAAEPAQEGQAAETPAEGEVIAAAEPEAPLPEAPVAVEAAEEPQDPQSDDAVSVDSA